MNKIKDLRTAANLSRSQLAEAADINIRTLEAYEQGLRDPAKMTIVTALKLAKALKCSPDELL